jgi:diguanylate cyclase (GGDEF)-like protein
MKTDNLYLETLKKLSVLYVEDEDSAREGLKFMLQSKVRTLFLAENGKVGLDKYIKYKPNIVITDIKMPYMDGIDMVKAIKKINPHAKIVYISAHTEADILLRAIDAGVDQYVPKPISKQPLFFALAKATKMILQENELLKKSKEMQLILDAQENMVLLTTGSEVLKANRATFDFFGVENINELKEKLTCVSDKFIKQEPYLYKVDGVNWAEKATDISNQYEVLMYDEMRDEDREFAIKSAPYTLEDANSKYVVTLTDITDLTIELSKNKDALTQVYNRRFIKKLLDDLLKNYKDSQKHFTTIMFSIDNLLDLNQKFGEDNSDDIIVEASSTIESMLNKHFFVGRYNGAQFIILAPLVDKDRANTIVQNMDKKLSNIENLEYSMAICEYDNKKSTEEYIKDCIDTLKLSKQSGNIETK